MSRLVRRQAWLSLAAGCLALLATGTAQATPKLPPVRHVFVIMLENEDYASTFGDPAADPYLARTLPKQGALLKDYYGTGHHSNDNYISLVSVSPRTRSTRPTAPPSSTSPARSLCPAASRAAPAACIRPRWRTSARS
jgi:hypothetical protein